MGVCVAGVCGYDHDHKVVKLYVCVDVSWSGAWLMIQQIMARCVLLLLTGDAAMCQLTQILQARQEARNFLAGKCVAPVCWCSRAPRAREHESTAAAQEAVPEWWTVAHGHGRAHTPGRRPQRCVFALTHADAIHVVVCRLQAALPRSVQATSAQQSLQPHTKNPRANEYRSSS